MEEEVDLFQEIEWNFNIFLIKKIYILCLRNYFIVSDQQELLKN